MITPTWLSASLRSLLHCSLKTFLSLLAILWNSAFKWIYLPFSPLPVASLLSSAIWRLSQITILPFCISFSWGWSWSLSPIQCQEPPSIVLQALCLSFLIPWICLSLWLYSLKGFDLGHTWMVWWFSYFLQLKSDFGNKEIMIWVIVSSRSCFCWLYRASPHLGAKNIINLILVLTIWWRPWVESLLCCWKAVFAMTSGFSWQNSISLCPASFRIPGPNLPVTPGVSWLQLLRSIPL